MKRMGIGLSRGGQRSVVVYDVLVVSTVADRSAVSLQEDFTIRTKMNEQLRTNNRVSHIH